MNKVTAASVGYPFLFMLIAVSSLELSGKVAMSILLLVITVMAFLVAHIREWNITAAISGLLAAAVACAMFAIVEYNTTHDYVEGVEYPTHLVGTVVKEPEYDGRYRYVIEPKKGSRVVFVSDKIGDGKLYSRFEGDVIIYLKESVSDGAHFYAYADNASDCRFTDGEDGVLTLFQSAREWTAKRLDEISSGTTAEFLKGVMLGDDSAMSTELRRSFRATGLAHILVVSGSHLTTVLLVITAMFTYLRGRKRVFYIIALLIMVFYMALVGFGASVVRSGICCVAIGLGYVFMRDSNPIDSLGAAGLLTGIINPYIAVSLGFQLSFFSAFGIVTVGFYLVKKIKSYRVPRIIKRLSALVVITVTAQLSILPVLIVIYDDMSFMSVFANLLVGFAVDLSVTFAVIYLVLSITFVLYPIALPFGFASALLARHCVAVADNLSHQALSYVRVPQLIYAVVIVTAFCAIFVAIVLKKRKTTVLAAVAVSLSIALATVSTVYYNDCVQIIAAADGAYIISYKGNAVVVGCGSYYGSKQLMYRVSEYGYYDVRLVVEGDSSTDSVIRVAEAVSPDAVIAYNSEKLVDLSRDRFALFGARDSVTPFDNCRVTDYDGCVLVSINGISIAVAKQLGEIPPELCADVLLCADNIRATAKTAVVIKDTNPLALSADKVYNTNSEYFTLTLSKRGSIISAN